MSHNFTVCKENQCTGCYSCVDVCSKHAITLKDSLDSYHAIIDTDKCVHCGKCYQVCQVVEPVALFVPKKWNQGWAVSHTTRTQSSSGGFATAMIEAFLRNGGYVCSCVFRDGEFGFEIVSTVDEYKKFAGSKYVKSNPKNAYSLLREHLHTKKVLFIGLPCQVAAVKKRFPEHENLYLIDLICHGTPSPKLLAMSLADYGYDLKKATSIQFRRDNKFGLEVDGTKILPVGVMDRYLYAFLSGLNYTENCYSCPYARKERIGDITLGDSWGSELTSEMEKGVSLCLCQSTKGAELLQMADLELFDVNIDKAIKSNHQLTHPTIAPQQRQKFFKNIRDGKSFNRSVFRCYKKPLFRQDLKAVLVKLHLYK